MMFLMLFLSTPSARRATTSSVSLAAAAFYFYPRPPRGGRRPSRSFLPGCRYFYPRPPRGGRPAAAARIAGVILFLSTPSARRATTWFLPVSTPKVFLSTPSARRATCSIYVFDLAEWISIHALREEGDLFPEQQHADFVDFYPRPPRGGRPLHLLLTPIRWNFYPRPPRGGRRPKEKRQRCGFSISIHALREEGDSKNRDKISIFKQIIQHSARI